MSPFKHLRRSSRRVRRTEGGTSLVELVMVIAILGVFLPTAFTAVSSMQKAESSTTDRFAALSDAQILANRLTKDLRAAVAASPTGAAFVAADTQEVTFYASLGDPNGPVRLRAYISTIPGTSVAAFYEDLTKADTTSTPPNYTYSGTASTRINGRYLDTSKPIFSYFTADAPNTPLATPVTALSDLRSIESVGVTFTTRVTPTSPSTTLTTRVHVRSVDYNPD
jgi:Tfp pilus assembly protein PilE